MAMAKIAGRLLSWGLPASRRLCSASASAPAGSTKVTETAVLSNFRPLYRRLSALGSIPGGNVAETMREWQREGMKVTVPELMSYVREFRRYKSYKTALELMDWMESERLAPNHAVRIDLISKLKGIQMAEEYFQSLPDLSKNHQTYGALLSCYCSKKLREKAVAIFEKMKESGLVTGPLAYNNLMSLHMKSGQAQEVERLFDEMKASSALPDKCSYKILIESYALQNDIDSIERIAQGIEQTEGAWDWSVYCHLAAIYNSANLFEKSRISLKKAELVMNGRDTSPFPFLLSLYAGAGDLLEVKRVWGLLNTRIRGARPPTNKEYLALLQALKRLDDIDAMREFFKEWESNFVSYDQKLMNVVIGAYLEKNMVEEARLLLETAAGKGIPPVLKSFCLFIHYYWRMGERDRAREWSSAASSFVKRGFESECLEKCLGRL